jgi:tetratricopeptide (TPR) repeat protein
MPILGGSKRPRLEGLTKEEERRRDALNPEVLRRAGEKGVAGQAPAAAALLREKLHAERDEYLWPLLLGHQMMSMRRYSQAIDAFEEAVRRQEGEVRAHYGAGMAYYQAGDYKQDRGSAAAHDVAPPDLTVDNLYQESLRHFRRALELTHDRSERDDLRNASAVVEKAIARKAGRL